jgi:hypothetical protein
MHVMVPPGQDAALAHAVGAVPPASVRVAQHTCGLTHRGVQAVTPAPLPASTPPPLEPLLLPLVLPELLPLLLEVPLLLLAVPLLLLPLPPLPVPLLPAPLPDEFPLPLPLLEPPPASSALPLLAPELPPPLLLAFPLSPNPSSLVEVAQPAGRTKPTDTKKNACVHFLMASDLERCPGDVATRSRRVAPRAALTTAPLNARATAIGIANCIWLRMRRAAS